MVNKGKLVPDDLSPEQRHLVNKRLTMNILIQGAASHAHLSAHHLVRDDLDQINTDLVPLYDQAIAGATYAYWRGFLPIIMGRSDKFESTREPLFLPSISAPSRSHDGR